MKNDFWEIETTGTSMSCSGIGISATRLLANQEKCTRLPHQKMLKRKIECFFFSLFNPSARGIGLFRRVYVSMKHVSFCGPFTLLITVVYFGQTQGNCYWQYPLGYLIMVFLNCVPLMKKMEMCFYFTNRGEKKGNYDLLVNYFFTPIYKMKINFCCIV